MVRESRFWPRAPCRVSPGGVPQPLDALQHLRAGPEDLAHGGARPVAGQAPVVHAACVEAAGGGPRGRKTPALGPRSFSMRAPLPDRGWQWRESPSPCFRPRGRAARRARCPPVQHNRRPARLAPASWAWPAPGVEQYGGAALEHAEEQRAQRLRAGPGQRRGGQLGLCQNGM